MTDRRDCTKPILKWRRQWVVSELWHLQPNQWVGQCAEAFEAPNTIRGQGPAWKWLQSSREILRWRRRHSSTRWCRWHEKAVGEGHAKSGCRCSWTAGAERASKHWCYTSIWPDYLRLSGWIACVCQLVDESDSWRLFKQPCDVPDEPDCWRSLMTKQAWSSMTVVPWW